LSKIRAAVQQKDEMANWLRFYISRRLHSALGCLSLMDLRKSSLPKTKGWSHNHAAMGDAERGQGHPPPACRQLPIRLRAHSERDETPKMAKASSRKKTSQKSAAAKKSVSPGQTSPAWVWSHYKGELAQSKQEKVALSNLQGKIQDNRQKAPKSRGANKKPTSERTIEQNVRELAKKDSEGRKAKGGFGTKKKYLIAGVLGGLFLAAIIYKEETENYAVNEPAQKSLPPAAFDERKSAATSASVKIDPKAIESLQVAAEKIGEVRDLGNEPELDAALKSLGKLRDSQIDNALKALREAYKTNKSTELNSAINQLEQITK
jgi:hypothetical protein